MKLIRDTLAQGQPVEIRIDNYLRGENEPKAGTR